MLFSWKLASDGTKKKRRTIQPPPCTSDRKDALKLKRGFGVMYAELVIVVTSSGTVLGSKLELKTMRAQQATGIRHQWNQAEMQREITQLLRYYTTNVSIYVNHTGRAIPQSTFFAMCSMFTVEILSCSHLFPHFEHLWF